MKTILFVCTGNICRSPTAQGVFEHLVREAGLADAIRVDSAGTHAGLPGSPPDFYAQQTAQERGVDISHLRARRITAPELGQYDLILAMDEDNFTFIQSLCPATERNKVKMLAAYCSGSKETEIGDPYGGGIRGFERTFELIWDCCVNLLKSVRSVEG